MSIIPGMGAFLDQVFQKLQMRGAAGEWNADQLASALQRAMAGTAMPPPAPPPLHVDAQSLSWVDDTTMIHDMLRRGYAVMKIPAEKIDTDQRS